MAIKAGARHFEPGMTLGQYLDPVCWSTIKWLEWTPILKLCSATRDERLLYQLWNYTWLKLMPFCYSVTKGLLNGCHKLCKYMELWRLLTFLFKTLKGLKQYRLHTACELLRKKIKNFFKNYIANFSLQLRWRWLYG